LNWLPLGGYVKMLGQDDIHPNSEVTDPRAYNMQPISKRMVIVSAGVIMNIILAAIGFCALFLHGFKAPAAVVGFIETLSPAQKAGLNIGDEIISIDGQRQYDFTKIYLTVALLPDGRDVPLVYKTPEGKTVTTTVRAARSENDARGMLMLGIGPARELRALDPNSRLAKQVVDYDPKHMPAELDLFRPGDVITAVGEVPVEHPESQQYLLDRALQKSDGQPITLTVADKSGTTRKVQIQPTLSSVFNDGSLDIAGMQPRAGGVRHAGEVHRRRPAQARRHHPGGAERGHRRHHAKPLGIDPARSPEPGGARRSRGEADRAAGWKGEGRPAGGEAHLQRGRRARGIGFPLEL
jgi:regulator of sigma E protease